MKSIRLFLALIKMAFFALFFREIVEAQLKVHLPEILRGKGWVMSPSVMLDSTQSYLTDWGMMLKLSDLISKAFDNEARLLGEFAHGSDSLEEFYIAGGLCRIETHHPIYSQHPTTIKTTDFLNWVDSL